MPRPVHLEAETRCYLVTSNTDGRASTFADPEAAQIIVDALYHLRLKGRMKLHAFVVMPDHLHFVASLTAGETLPKLMHSLKSYTAKEINRRRGSKGTVWQGGFHSHGVRDERDMLTKIDYLLKNPIRAGLAGSVEEYGVSSGNGAYEVDPC